MTDKVVKIVIMTSFYVCRYFFQIYKHTETETYLIHIIYVCHICLFIKHIRKIRKSQSINKRNDYY